MIKHTNDQDVKAKIIKSSRMFNFNPWHSTTQLFVSIMYKIGIKISLNSKKMRKKNWMKKSGLSQSNFARKTI